MPAADHVVIVGASGAGVGTALDLRAHGHAGRITLIGAESHLPYDRPPLSKGVLSGTQEFEDIALTSHEELAEKGIVCRLGVAATALDLAQKTVHLSDGEDIDYGTLVIATGASPRRLPQFDGYGNAFVLRTLSDAAELRRRLTPGSRLGIVGGGLIGLEVAASAVNLGVTVTVIEPTEQPLANRITPELSAWLLEQHRSNEVNLVLGASCTEIVADGREITELVVSDGSRVPVDVVLISIGASPNVEWLEGSGVEITNGVVVDEYQQACEDVFAVGDVANGFHPGYRRHMRFETRANATEGAAHLALTLSGTRSAYVPVPFFWTDQFGFKLQSFGMIGPGDEYDLAWGELDSRKWGLVGRHNGEITGFLTSGFGPQLAQHRRELADAIERTVVSGEA
ncbi:NAD(P)/FAD-dependent oxidoreductase [Herbiconiux ginsengi]|nr:FAD-dependent oxidoreductase [Herbiconiux ginsengi]